MWYVSRFEWMKLQSALIFLTGFESMHRRHTHMHTLITFKFTTITILRGERNVLEWKNLKKNKWNIFSGWADFCIYYINTVVAHIGCIVRQRHKITCHQTPFTQWRAFSVRINKQPTTTTITKAVRNNGQRSKVYHRMWKKKNQNRNLVCLSNQSVFFLVWSGLFRFSLSSNSINTVVSRIILIFFLMRVFHIFSWVSRTNGIYVINK